MCVHLRPVRRMGGFLLRPDMGLSLDPSQQAAEDFTIVSHVELDSTGRAYGGAATAALAQLADVRPAVVEGDGPDVANVRARAT